MRDFICDVCRVGFDDDSMMHYLPNGKKVCSQCFVKELKKGEEKWIEENPCPFKVVGHKEIVDMAASPEAQQKMIEERGTVYFYSEPRTVCKLMPFNPLLDTCIGEKNCPIYNGGVRNVR